MLKKKLDLRSEFKLFHRQDESNEQSFWNEYSKLSIDAGLMSCEYNANKFDYVSRKLKNLKLFLVGENC